MDVIAAKLERFSAFLKEQQQKDGRESASEIDAKTTERVGKLVQSVFKAIKSKGLQLRNSPPFLQEILSGIYQHVQLLTASTPVDALKACVPFRVFLVGFVAKAELVLKLIKTSGDAIHSPDSQPRKALTRVTLTLSHVLADFKAMFPNGKIVNSTYIKFAKREAGEFWFSSFGDKMIVTWEEFIHAFNNVHHVRTPEEKMAIKASINLTENDNVTWFEFDVFTRLFQPWKQILNNWNVIVVAHPGYQAFMTYDEVSALLNQFIDKPGSYVFRLSCTRLGQWAIGYVTSDRKIVQTIPQSKSLYQALIDGAADGTYRYPAGHDYNPDIRQAIQVSPEEHIMVTQEQFEIYAEMDSRFEMCKICSERDKNVRINPCGHLLCNVCVAQWRHAGSNKCPFCRDEMKDIEPVTVTPFQKGAGGGDMEDEDDLDIPPPVPKRPPAASVSSFGSLRFLSRATEAPQRPELPAPPLPHASRLRMARNGPTAFPASPSLVRAQLHHSNSLTQLIGPGGVRSTQAAQPVQTQSAPAQQYRTSDTDDLAYLPDPGSGTSLRTSFTSDGDASSRKSSDNDAVPRKLSSTAAPSEYEMPTRRSPAQPVQPPRNANPMYFDPNQSLPAPPAQTMPYMEAGGFDRNQALPPAPLSSSPSTPIQMRAVPSGITESLVTCPVCQRQMSESLINPHLDQCAQLH
eukprot:Opistho-2@69582